MSLPNQESPRKIFVSGHRGMVGSAIVRALKRVGRDQVVTRARDELDLLDQMAVTRFLDSECPDIVIIAAAKVGGIYANSSYPADFLYQNLMIECNLIHGAFSAGVPKLLMLGSSCIYPRDATQPIRESDLLTGELERTNEAYAIAKIAGLKLCESYNQQYNTDYRSLMPSNLYGPGDNFHPNNSHVVPALMRRFHEARALKKDAVTLWGTGTPKREFLYVDDLAEACIFILNLDRARYRACLNAHHGHINVGSGTDVTISALADLIASIVGFEGNILTDLSMPDGTPRKLMNIEIMESLGWHAKTSLEDGLRNTYAWFIKNSENARGSEYDLLSEP